MNISNKLFYKQNVAASYIALERKQKINFKLYCAYSTSASEVLDKGKLKENLQMANETMGYVLSRIKKVATWGVEPPVTEKKIEELFEVDKQVKNTRDIRKKIFEKQPREKATIFVEAAIFAHVVEQTGSGNCGEMGNLGLMYLATKGWPGRAGVFEIYRTQTAPVPKELPLAKPKEHKHIFSILGLGPNSMVYGNDVQSYGVNSVVVDSYAKEFYPIQEIFDRLHNYYGINRETWRPMLAKMNPAVDRIQLLYSNIFSALEFIEPFLMYKNIHSNAIEIVRLLNAFHISESRVDKLVIMDQIMTKLPSLLKILENMGSNFLIEGQNRIEDCKNNIYILRSQLEKFKDPTVPLFTN